MRYGSGYRAKRCFHFRLTAAAFLVCFWLLPAAAAFPDVEMTGFKLVQETGSGRWEIRAETAYYDGQGDVVLQEVSAIMLDNGAEKVRVDSDKGLYETGGLMLYLEGSVTVASAWGSRFETPKLQWDGSRAVMTADGGVRLVRKGWRVTGRSVRYTLNTGTAVVDGDVRTTLIEGRDRR